MDQCDAQYKPQVYQSKRGGQYRHNSNQNDYRSRNRFCSRDRTRSTSLEVDKILVEIIDQIIEVDYRIILGKAIDRTITGEITYETVIEITLGKTIEKIDIDIQEIEAIVEMDIEIIIEVI